MIAKTTMGIRGPAPKPRQLRILQGNPGRRKLNPQEPMPQAITPPPPPEHLPQIANEVWLEVAEQLCRAHLLTSLDLILLELFCQSYATFREASGFVEQHGEHFAVTNAKGECQVVRPNPAVAIRASCMAQMSKIGAELGLSPASRRTGLPTGSTTGSTLPDQPY